MKVSVSDIFLEEFKTPLLDFARGKSGKRWYALIAVTVKEADPESHQQTFYLLACSQSAAKKPLKSMPRPDKRYTVLENSFDMSKLRKAVLHRIASSEASDWPDFCKQMRRHFLEREGGR